tara:strand:+ start:12956 stop:13438 length:483 start_codon:yes stop_codon:yes gene_type:complete
LIAVDYTQYSATGALEESILTGIDQLDLDFLAEYFSMPLSSFVEKASNKKFRLKACKIIEKKEIHHQLKTMELYPAQFGQVSVYILKNKPKPLENHLLKHDINILPGIEIFKEVHSKQNSSESHAGKCFFLAKGSQLFVPPLKEDLQILQLSFELEIEKL